MRVLGKECRYVRVERTDSVRQMCSFVRVVRLLRALGVLCSGSAALKRRVRGLFSRGDRL